ncbi:hypothetical protein LOK74_04040 [Brevibacillus humidisoli]|uniref:hypothetical protein n=1 Tax=Brevibacillus humidisoli TaxID=2895522 RepID=UPI001E636B22|nr:hypothetical protein [Brevibacillus humidisoli]UFJ41694.1 hypothetical protein LOK74_04040 [Brevibacillus humidisoli]
MPGANERQNVRQEGLTHMQAELPAQGTALNPSESGWVFDENASTAPVEKLDSAMQQGE